MKKTLFSILALVALAGSLQAQTEKSTLRDERIRTAHGIRSGAITRGEAALIKKQAKDVRRARRLAMADGKVSPRERVMIAHQDRQLDRTIRRSKHNRRSR